MRDVSLAGDHRTGARVVRAPQDLRIVVVEGTRHGDDAGLEQAEDGAAPIRARGQLHQDAIAGHEASLSEEPRPPGRLAGHLRERSPVDNALRVDRGHRRAVAIGSRMRTGGRLVVDQLVVHGADVAFGVPGESYLAVLDALHDSPLRFVTCRHEVGAANMADAYGKLTGRPGICMVTRGPGATHAAGGIHTAYQDSTPLILLIGQAARTMMGREAFQEIDYRHMRPAN